MSAPFAVTVVIPVRNGMPDLIDAVASALAQSLPPAEVLVLDDSSSDGGGDAVEQRFGRVRDAADRPRVRVLRGRWGSAGAARNAGWRAAATPWVGFLDADDIWFDEKLASAAAVLARVPGAGWFFSDGAFRTLDGELRTSWFASYARMPEIYAGHPVAELLDVNFILTSSVLARRSLLEALGGFDERMSHAEDVDLWIRMARRAPAAASQRALVRYQHREGGLTRQIEARLSGNAELYERLAGDEGLPPELRARASRRAALSRLKLAHVALRDGDGARARRHLRGAWATRRGTGAVLAALCLSLMPAPTVAWLRGQAWAKRGAASAAVRFEPVTLVTEPGLMVEAVPGRGMAAVDRTRPSGPPR